MTLCGTVSGPGKKTRESKTHTVLSGEYHIPLHGEYLILGILQRQWVAPMPNQRLFVSGLVPLP